MKLLYLKVFTQLLRQIILKKLAKAPFFDNCITCSDSSTPRRFQVIHRINSSKPTFLNRVSTEDDTQPVIPEFSVT